MYPKTDDSTFDMDYYCATHMPMLADALGDACKGWGASSIGSGFGVRHRMLQLALELCSAAFGDCLASGGNFGTRRCGLAEGRCAR